MRRGRRVLLAAVVMAITLPISSPAEAATRHPCPTGYLCLYRHVDFKGQIVKMKRPEYSEKVYIGMNDEASSVKNKSGRRAVLWADFESGDKACLEPGQKVRDLSDLSPDMNDTISSTSILATGASCPA
jgi:hypothetical protein